MTLTAKFLSYANRVLLRLREGAQEYGNKSFSMDPLDLLTEIQEELEDICGWSYILHSRLGEIRKRYEGMGDSLVEHLGSPDAKR